MVYNEGFEIRYKGITILLFNDYYRVKDSKFRCNCGKTLVGWYNINGNMMGCVVGSRSDNQDMINDSNLEGNIVL